MFPARPSSPTLHTVTNFPCFAYPSLFSRANSKSNRSLLRSALAHLSFQAPPSITVPAAQIPHELSSPIHPQRLSRTSPVYP